MEKKPKGESLKTQAGQYAVQLKVRGGYHEQEI
jgi:hypothetical protein